MIRVIFGQQTQHPVLNKSVHTCLQVLPTTEVANNRRLSQKTEIEAYMYIEDVCYYPLYR